MVGSFLSITVDLNPETSPKTLTLRRFSPENKTSYYTLIKYSDEPSAFKYTQWTVDHTGTLGTRKALGHLRYLGTRTFWAPRNFGSQGAWTLKHTGIMALKKL